MENPLRSRSAPASLRWERVQTWGAGVLGTDPVVRVLVLLLPVVKLLGVASVTPSIYPDGRTYRTRGSWLDFSLTSLDGYSVRPWGITAWMALWPGDRAIMLAQTVLSAVAWGALAVVVATGIRHSLMRRFFVLAMVLIPCTAQISNWDSVMQGDSLPMSVGILSLAALVRLARVPTWDRAVGFLALALWFSMTRPNAFFVLLVWAAGLVLLGLLQRRLLVVGLVAALLLLFSAYSYIYNVRSDAAWHDKIGYSRSVVAMAYPLGRYDPVATTVIKDLRKSDAPSCMFPPNPAAVTRHGTTHWAATTSVSCPGMDPWAMKNWTRWWVGWLLHHPGSMVRIIHSQLPESLSPSVWGDVTAATPNSVSALFLGSPTQPQSAFPTRTYRTQPLIFWFIGGLALALVARSRRLWRGSPWATDLVLGVTVVGGLVGAVSSGLLIQTVPHEVAQESLGATALITAALVAAVAIGADRLLGPPTEPAP